MLRSRRLFAAALALAVPAFSLAQTVVPAPMPSAIPTQLPMTRPVPMVMTPAAPSAVPAPVVMATDPTVAAPEAAAEEPAAAADKFLVEKLLGGTTAGAQLLENGWRIYGWTQGSFTTGSVRGNAFPVPFTDRVEQFSLNQNWLHVEKAIDTSKKEWQLGGAADMILPGTDARITRSRGLFDNQAGKTTGIDLFQAYVDLFAPGVGPQGTIFRVGKFATHCEYEVVQGISNPFLSRSYLFQFNPFTHTGVNAITALNDDVTVSNGIVLGNDNFFGAPDRATYIGQVKWAPKEGKSSILLNVSVTNPRFDQVDNFAFYNVYNLQFTHKLTDKLQYVLDTTFSHMDNVTVDDRLTSANWYGFANYLFYDLTDKIQLKARAELFEDSKGVRTGTAGLYTAFTGGVTWKPMPWLYVMPEVRYDNNSRGVPFEGNKNMFTASIGSIVRW